MQHLVATFSTPDAWVAVFTLALLEIVLGIDNLVFIAILTNRVPAEKQKFTRQFGLMAALVTRLMLLFSLSWIAHLDVALFTVSFVKVAGAPLEITGETIVLLLGGLFLIYKAVSEIYHKVELKDEGIRGAKGQSTVAAVIINIALMDIVFSLDSVITAVGMVDEVAIMVVGVVIAMIVMVTFADPVSNFINKHASLKILALSFLLMIGTLLTAEALHFGVPKGFVYFAMFFALGVQLVQMRYESNLQKHEALDAEAPV